MDHLSSFPNSGDFSIRNALETPQSFRPNVLHISYVPGVKLAASSAVAASISGVESGPEIGPSRTTRQDRGA